VNTDLLINESELPRPEGVVEELAMVIPVVIRAVGLRMVRRSKNGHLVTVDRIVAEEMLHLVRHLNKTRGK